MRDNVPEVADEEITTHERPGPTPSRQNQVSPEPGPKRPEVDPPGAHAEPTRGPQHVVAARERGQADIEEESVLAEVLARLDPRSHQRLRRGNSVGTGGMGSVHQVFDQNLRRATAMKTIHTTRWESPKMRQLFLREARIMAQLDHPNVVPIHELGLADDGRLFFTMKLVEGRTLRQAIRALPRPLRRNDVMDMVDVVVKVCNALAYAHSRGVIHRDIKPSNVMLGEYGEVYLMDWGLARIEHQADPTDDEDGARAVAPALMDDMPSSPNGESLAGNYVGTPSYMAPEQATGRKVGARADVFAVGGLLYYLFAQRSPFHGETALHSLGRSAVCAYTPIFELEEHVPPSLGAIIQRAMAKHPRDRYPSVDALRDALVAFLRGDLSFPRRTYAAGELIVEAGDKGNDAFRIVRGRCEAFLMVEGERKSFRVMESGEGFGETALLSEDGTRSACVQALEETEVEVVTRELFEEELSAMKPWMAAFIRDLAARFRDK